MLAGGVMVARIKKRYERRQVVEVVRKIVRGTEAAVHSRIEQTQRSTQALINTAYIERLNATFSSRLASLVRRTRAGAHKRSTLEAGMWLVGSCYNLLWVHRSLGEGYTPAMAAGLTSHRWSMEELLTFPVAPAELPTWRGAEASVATGGRACSLTTVQCGATGRVRSSPQSPKRGDRCVPYQQR